MSILDIRYYRYHTADCTAQHTHFLVQSKIETWCGGEIIPVYCSCCRCQMAVMLDSVLITEG